MNWVHEIGARLAPRGLAQRLTLAFAAMMSLFVLAVLAINQATQYVLIQERMTMSVDHFLKLTEEVSVPYLLDANPAGLDIFFEEAQRRSDIASIMLVDEDGALLVMGGSSEFAFLSLTDDPLTVMALESGERQMEMVGEILHVAGPLMLHDRLVGVVRVAFDEHEVLAEMHTLRQTTLVAGVIVLILGIILTGVLSRRLTRPLLALTHAADRAARGVLDQKIALNSNDELDRLASSFNTMLGNLRGSMDEIQRIAYEDKLTGIPNRSWLNMQLEQVVRALHGDPRGFSVMFLDLDKFKSVNDTYGHHVGDELLRGFADRIASCVRDEGLTIVGVRPDLSLPIAVGDDEAVVARLAGDEFTVVLPVDKAETVGKRIVRAMRHAFMLDGQRLLTSASIGIAHFPAHGKTREQVLKSADVAMYQAKEAGRNRVRLYDAASHEKLHQRSDLERALEKAVAEAAFDVALQPQFEVETNRIVGAEALIRWHHPERGTIPPATFLPAAARMGLMPTIGHIMLSKAIEISTDLNRGREIPLRIAVNLAIEELSEAGFADTVESFLHKHDAKAEYLELEITEGTAMEQCSQVELEIAKLRALGVRFAIDDFGVGYSNLGRLKALAFETLKVDRSLVKELGDDKAAESLMTTVLDMALALGADVVVEGVETERQFAFLRRAGCQFYQGYLGARPMPVDLFKELLADDEMQAAMDDDQARPDLKLVS